MGRYKVNQTTGALSLMAGRGKGAMSIIAPTKTNQSFFGQWSAYPSYGFYRMNIFIPHRAFNVSLVAAYWLNDAGTTGTDVTANARLVTTDSDYCIEVLCDNSAVAGKTANVTLGITNA